MRKICIFALLALSAALLSACKDEPLSAPDEQQIGAMRPSNDMLELGQELQDPYRIDIMRQAYANITGSKSALEPTHRYLRFLPKDDDEYYRLKAANLELFDFPLHYEIAQPGTYYHDPALPADAITWQYCVVPVGRELPEDIAHELLYEVFIPTASVDGSKSGLLDALEDEAMRLTGHTELIPPADGAKAKRWNPSGTIKVWDDVRQQLEPLVGARVHARWLTHVETCLTDANGYFRTASFRFQVNYSIKWERADFDIRSGNWGQAWYNGPKQKTAWNLDITKGGLSWVYAQVLRWANKYWYDNTLGIKTPPQNTTWKRAVKIGVMDKDGRAFYSRTNRWTTFPEIKIYRYEEGKECRADRLLEIVCHELAHASHWDMDKEIYRKADRIVKESWAVGVGCFFADDEYHNQTISKWNYGANFTWIKNEGEGLYTPLVVDLRDGINQYGADLPIDRVSGYSLYQIEQALKGCTTLAQWRDRLKSMYSNPTSVYLDELFDNYINL